MRRSNHKAGKLSLLFLLAVTAAAQETPMRRPVPSIQTVYAGPVRAEMARISADLNNTNAATSVEVQLSNSSDQQVQEDVALAESKLAKPTRVQRLLIAPRSFTPVQETYEYPVTGEKLKVLRFNPRLEVGGKPWLDRVKSTTVQLKLPAGVQQLVYSSLANGKLSKDPSDGRTVVTYSLNNVYLVPVTIKWNAEAQLEIRKTAYRQDRVLNVEVLVKNVGPNAITDAVVSDSFHPGFVESGTPQAEFEMVQGAQNDRRWVWKHNLASLAPGDTAVLKYQVQLRSSPNGLTFGGTTISRKDTGELLGASTPLALPK
jgi:hypothetical protein